MGKLRTEWYKLTGEGADAQYLTWNQVPDTVRFEAETLTNMAYDMSNTPRISFETLKGIGKASGTAFRFMFMGAHMAVENHGEVIGEFLQRRVNFIVSALGSINPTEFSKASQTIDIETELVPYMIDDLNDKVTTAVSAVSGGVWSRREGIMFAGNADRIDEELRKSKRNRWQRMSKSEIRDRKTPLSQKNYGIYNFLIGKKEINKKTCRLSTGFLFYQNGLEINRTLSFF